MNPPVRTASDRAEWGRWDVADSRTIYAGIPQECGYAETLAWARPAIDIDLADLFDPSEGETAADLGGLTLTTEAESEWSSRHHMGVGKVAAGWRQERLIHELTLPESGWFVQVDAAETISAITRRWPDILASAGVQQLTTAHIHGEQRPLTTTLGEKIRGEVLWDGSLPHGVTYVSKHDSQWRCWAIWLRALDDGKPLSSEPTKAGHGAPIEPPATNPALHKVCGLFGIVCH